MAIQITEPAAEQQAAAERQHVGVDHPYERGFAKDEGGRDGRQRDVHDRRVEHDHQHAEAQYDQREPALLAVDGVGHAGAPVARERAGWIFESSTRLFRVTTTKYWASWL